jgi:replicative DNA helicase
LRELVSVGRELVEGALDTSEDTSPMDRIAQAEADLFRVAEGASTGREAATFREAAMAAIKMAEAAMNSGGGLSGKTTGLETIDRKTSGLHNSDLIILAGRPGMGKTSLATNIAFNCAEKHLEWQREGGEFNYGAPVAFFSLEMSADQLATRILAEQAEISSESLRSGKLSREDFQKLSFASQRLAELPLYIDDTPALTIAALRTRARRMKRRHDIGLIIVDYLQLLQGSGRANDNRVNEISEISRGLKTLAKELQVPVIALSQLSRAVESREDKRPQLSDLRESGSIEQDADMVWFIFRGDYYHLLVKPDTPDASSPPDVQEKYRSWARRPLSSPSNATVRPATCRSTSRATSPNSLRRTTRIIPTTASNRRRFTRCSVLRGRGARNRRWQAVRTRPSRSRLPAPARDRASGHGDYRGAPGRSRPDRYPPARLPVPRDRARAPIWARYSRARASGNAPAVQA